MPTDNTVKGERTFHDSPTGARKEVKPAAFHLLPWATVWQVAELFDAGARKYGERNWEKGLIWSLLFASLMRHLTLWWEGEDYDEETGSHHLAAVVFHAIVLLTFVRTHPQGDDRPNRKVFD